MSRFKIKKCPRGGGRQRRQIAFRKSEPASFRVTTFRCADFPFEKQELGSSGERSAEESFTRCDPLKLGGFRYACEQGTNESVRLAVPATRLVGIDPDRFLFFGGELAQLNEKGGAVTTVRSMRRAVRAAQIPASRIIGSVFRKGTASTRISSPPGWVCSGNTESGAYLTRLVARACSRPMRSSMTRSTPGCGDGTQR